MPPDHLSQCVLPVPFLPWSPRGRQVTAVPYDIVTLSRVTPRPHLRRTPLRDHRLGLAPPPQEAPPFVHMDELLSSRLFVSLMFFPTQSPYEVTPSKRKASTTASPGPNWSPALAPDFQGARTVLSTPYSCRALTDVSTSTCPNRINLRHPLFLPTSLSYECH